MTELNDRELNIIQETHDTVIELKVVLLGKNGDPGLCKKVEQITEDHYKLKRNFWILVGLLVGSGAIAGSVFELMK